MAIEKGSEREKNLLASFTGESQARNRYTYFASLSQLRNSSTKNDTWGF